MSNLHVKNSSATQKLSKNNIKKIPDEAVLAQLTLDITLDLNQNHPLLQDPIVANKLLMENILHSAFSIPNHGPKSALDSNTDNQETSTIFSNIDDNKPPEGNVLQYLSDSEGGGSDPDSKSAKKGSKMTITVPKPNAGIPKRRNSDDNIFRPSNSLLSGIDNKGTDDNKPKGNKDTDDNQPKGNKGNDDNKPKSNKGTVSFNNRQLDTSIEASDNSDLKNKPINKATENKPTPNFNDSRNEVRKPLDNTVKVDTTIPKPSRTNAPVNPIKVKLNMHEKNDGDYNKLVEKTVLLGGEDFYETLNLENAPQNFKDLNNMDVIFHVTRQLVDIKNGATEVIFRIIELEKGSAKVVSACTTQVISSEEDRINGQAFRTRADKYLEIQTVRAGKARS